MAPELRIAPPDRDARVADQLDRIFERRERESRLALALARDYPAFDRGLALLAEEASEPLGFALYVPRTIRIRGADVKVAVAAPFGVLPRARRRGVGRFLDASATPALRDRGIRAAIVIGAPEFYRAVGYEPAFDAYIERVPTAVLPAEERAPARWTALDSRHLADLCAIQSACYGAVDGSERRLPAAIDWESAIEGAHTLVLEERGRAEGYLRFRVRAELEIPECGVRTKAAVETVLALMRRLAREHAKSQVEAHLPPPHPVARELFERGAVLEAHDLGGAATMKVVDWKGVLEDVRASLVPALERVAPASISLEIGGATRRLSAKRGELVVADGRDPRRHLFVPEGWGAGLLTGRRSADDLLFDPRVRERSTLDDEAIALVRALFPPRTPMWTYSPVWEIADE